MLFLSSSFFSLGVCDTKSISSLSINLINLKRGRCILKLYVSIMYYKFTYHFFHVNPKVFLSLMQAKYSLISSTNKNRPFIQLLMRYVRKYNFLSFSSLIFINIITHQNIYCPSNKFHEVRHF